MTDIEFHFNAPDKLVHACRYARKLLKNDRRLVITGPESVLEDIDAMLWNMSAHDFVAHCRGDSDPQLLDASPIVLASDPSQSPHRDVLLNLGDTLPQDFDRYGKLVEVNQTVCMRARWRHYAQQGYGLVRHDLVQKAR